MRRIVFGSVLFLGIIGIVAGVSTYAWFTSQAISNDNIFMSGKLEIGLPFTGANDGFIEATNLYPGSSVTDTVDVQNNGEIIFKYKVTSDQNSGDEALYNNLNTVILKDDIVIYDGTLKDLDANIGNIVPGDKETLTFTVSLPETAGDECQEKIANTKFIFDATQIENTN